MYIGPFPSNDNTPVSASSSTSSVPKDRAHLRVASTSDDAVRGKPTAAACDRFPDVDDILERLTNHTDIARQSAGQRG